jgi:hypothetical protein
MKIIEPKGEYMMCYLMALQVKTVLFMMVQLMYLATWKGLYHSNFKEVLGESAHKSYLQRILTLSMDKTL